MAIGSLNSVGFKGLQYPYAQGVKSDFAPANEKASSKKKAAIIASAAVGLAIAAALGIWYIKRGKKPSVKNLLGGLSPETRQLVEQTQQAMVKENALKTVAEVAETEARRSPQYVQEAREFFTRAFSDPKYAQTVAAAA